MLLRNESLGRYRRCGTFSSMGPCRRRWTPSNPNSTQVSVPCWTRRARASSRSSSGSGGSANGGFFSWYTKQLDKRPLTTKIISSALIAASGDVICQLLENNLGAGNKNDQKETAEIPSMEQRQTKNKAAEATASSLDTDIDWSRTGRFLLIGAFWVAPATHLWYGFLSTRLIPGAATSTRIVQRLFVDQFGAAPVFCPTFMGLLWLLEGKTPSEVKMDLIQAGPTLVTSNWILWIPAMGVMFSVVPLKFQVVYSNFVGLVWTVYLSYASTRLSSQPTEQQK